MKQLGNSQSIYSVSGAVFEMDTTLKKQMMEEESSPEILSAFHQVSTVALSLIQLHQQHRVDNAE